MQTPTFLILLLAFTLLACSLTPERDETVEETPVTHSGELVEATQEPSSTGSPPTAALAAVPYFGEQSIEERIANADSIVKARLATTTSEIVTTTAEEWSEYYYVGIRLHLTVSEYLKGSGASSITAFTIQGGDYDTQMEAENAAPDIAANRVTTWDDREAIIFLNGDDPYDIFSASVQGANDYFLTIGDTYHDWYSLQNVDSKLWLPSAGTSATGTTRGFCSQRPRRARTRRR